MRKLMILGVFLLLSLNLVQGVQGQGASSGQVAMTGTDGNIYLYDLAAASLTPVTEDGDGANKAYIWPTWSSDGQLAYFGSNTDPNNAYSLAIFMRSAQGVSKGVYSSESEVFTYAYWSPANCTANSGTCRDLAILYTSQNGLAVRNVRSAGKYEVSEVDTGSPFYWDWSPDGRYMFWARFGQTLEIYDAETREVIQTLPDTQGLQQAVDWSPVDNRLLTTVINARGLSDLVIIRENGREVLLENLQDIVAYEWSPNGENVAVLNRTTGELATVNVSSKQVFTVPGQLVIGFFWSPDATKLAYLSLTDTRGSGDARPAGQQTALRWYVYDFTTNTNTAFSTFSPSSDMVYYLSFFDQFARSHRLWSPDSRYLVYGEAFVNGQQVVNLLDVQTPGSAPVQIGEGTIGIFSWN